MCISASASINAFFFNLISVGLLIKYGNENLKTYNLIIGLFSIFTSFMQLVDLGIWRDLDCKTGLNKAASIVGPILTYLQPTMVFVIALIVFNYSKHGANIPQKLNNTVFENFTITHKKINFINIINLIYFAIIIYALFQYFMKESKTGFCSGLVGSY